MPRAMPPAGATTLDAVRRKAASCTACDLYKRATQTVFGEGNPRASIMLIGEQPGHEEDLAGRPFVGPAGQVLDRALAEAGLDRKKAYLTNAVKHFKNECRVWLQKELELVRPQLVLALGVTAAVALAGRPVVLSRERGKVLDFPGGLRGMVTAHPSSILRMPDPAARHAAFAALVKDLKAAVKQAAA